ncbi:MAG: cyclase family protein [Chloroflexi bacterium]|nr:cyclase family protein [Chloroflexota bacterium]
MTIHDITLTIHRSLVVWPMSPTVALSHLSHQAKGEDATVTYMSLNVHTGTHVDAPRHFLAGQSTVETLDLDVLVGPALVVDARSIERLTADALASLNIPPGTERLLVLTRNSELWNDNTHPFAEDYVGVDASGAQWLIDNGVRLIGVDYLSVAPYDELEPPHTLLLGADVVIVEGLDLRGIKPGEYQFVCLPLKIADSDGSPARAILIET